MIQGGKKVHMFTAYSIPLRPETSDEMQLDVTLNLPRDLTIRTLAVDWRARHL